MTGTRLHSGAGNPVELGAALGRGGEGSVFAIQGRPGFVAKVYHQPASTQQALKLENMARQAHPSLLEIAAWPVDVLRAAPGSPVCGFIMPRVNGYHEIHSLYGPAHRRRLFPHADWSFLVHAARNLASAFEAIHARGHVVGDVNPGNVVISAQALVRLIDCDSFQIDTGERLFPCEVGVPQFTAPELQDRPFQGLQRTPDHDAFGLAVLCFHLLFLGRHPFAGRYRDDSDMPIEQAIRECRFAFGRHAASRGMEPPPHSLPLSALPDTVAGLFERAFAAPTLAHGRPSARDWRLALERLGAELQGCARNPMHKYPQRLLNCPWCTLERASGTRFFTAPTPSTADGMPSGHGEFDLDRLWSRVLALPSPGDESLPATTATALPEPTPLPDALHQAQLLDRLRGTAAGAGALLATVLQPALLWLWLPLALLAWLGLRDTTLRREYQRRRQVLLATRQERVDLQLAWQQQASEQPFRQKLHELQALRQHHADLNTAFLSERQRLDSDRRQAQLQTFLEGHFLDTAQIPGIRTTDRMALESYGIETAADVSAAALRAIPGFGERLGAPRAAALLAWRQNLEQRFRYDPRQNTEPGAIAQLAQRYAQEQRALEQALLKGADELGRLRAQILQQRARLSIELRRQVMEEQQARADLRVFRLLPALLALWRRLFYHP